MLLIGLKILIGLVAGTLVGLTGLGGGVLMLPILMFGLHVPPITAVGSDAVFNCFTKVGAGYLHWRQRTVNWRLALALAVGSTPGAIAGVTLLGHIRAVSGSGVNDFLRYAVGLLLVVIPPLLLLQSQIESSWVAAQQSRRHWLGAAGIGLFAGFLVGMTSVGSGTVILMLLLLFYRYSPAQMVGTDIVHAVILTGTTSLLHFRLGTVDPVLVASLLIGSIPGGLLGARWSAHVPVRWLRRILCAILFASGARMLWV